MCGPKPSLGSSTLGAKNSRVPEHPRCVVTGQRRAEVFVCSFGSDAVHVWACAKKPDSGG